MQYMCVGCIYLLNRVKKRGVNGVHLSLFCIFAHLYKTHIDIIL